MERDDDGSTHVLEAIILALILLGAAHSVTTLRSERADTERPRASLERTARDAMTILSGLEDANGTLLDAYLVETVHCALDAVPSETSCDGVRSANLSLKIQYYLPAGAGYAVGLDNGVRTRDLYRSVLAPGETVSASFAYTPTWNLTFVQPEMSCYESGMDVNLTAIPLRRGGLGNLTNLTFNASVGEVAHANLSHRAAVWNASLPAATRPSSGIVFANATSRGGTFPGGFELASCDLGGVGPLLVAAMRLGTFSATPSVVPTGTAVSFAADLSVLEALPDVAVLSSNVTVYEPLPPRADALESYLVAKVADRLDPVGGAAGWDVPEDALLGIHPVVLKAKVRTGDGHEVEVRKVDYVTVALPDGTVPIDPPYRAVLQVWFPDWR